MAKEEKISFYYDKEEDGDLKGLIAKLKKNHPVFKDRSESAIARILVRDALKEAHKDSKS